MPVSAASCWFLVFQVYELPFIVVLDHRKESVVVAVRGTMSLQVMLRVLDRFRPGHWVEQGVRHNRVLRAKESFC